MSTPKTRTVLITGATDGIGLALARHYSAAGAQLILVGRRALGELDAAFFQRDNYCQADLSQPACAEIIVSWLDERQINRLDLVIHNAGLGYVGALDDQPAASIKTLTAVNLKAPVALTHHLLPRVEAAAGQLAYISSVASVLPGPNYAVYSATKAALDGFVRNLQVELSAAEIPVSTHLIHPGATRTGMHHKSGVSRDEMDWSQFPPAEDVAAQIVTIVERGRRRQAVGTSNRLALAAGRNAPNAIEGLMRRRASDDSGTSAASLAEGERHCVITGAADGIGRSLALRYADAGFTITGIDLDRERAMRTQAEIINAGGRARFIIADLSSTDDLVQIVAQLDQRPPIDVLIHNAGISSVGSFQSQALAPQMAVLDINFVAPLLLTAELLRQRKLSRQSSIIFMASLSYFVSYPGAAVYAASKDGLVSFARSLSVALKPQSTNILTVFPGPTRTAHARRYSPDNKNEDRRMSPEKLAALIFRASQRRQRLLIPGAGNRFFATAGRLFPTLTERAMRRMILDKLERQ